MWDSPAMSRSNSAGQAGKSLIKKLSRLKVEFSIFLKVRHKYLHFMDSQIISILKQTESYSAGPELCREHEIRSQVL